MRNRYSTAVALALLLCGCRPNGEKKDVEAEAPAAVQVAKAVRQPIERVVNAEAILYPVKQAAIASKISAPLERVFVNRGDRVRKGQLLARLEDRDLVAAANESKALYAQAQAQFNTTTRAQLPEDAVKARADAASARQVLDAAKHVFESREALVKEGALAQKLADDARVAQAQAQGQYDSAAEHLRALDNVSRGEQVIGAQSQVEAAKARFNDAEAQVAYAEIRSPIDGIVSDRPFAAGEMVSGGSALITVVDTSQIVARANVPVRDVEYLKPGQRATISAPGGELTGSVWVVSPAVDPASTTLEVWVKADNPGGKLKPGVTARVAVQAQSIPDAIVVPKAALLSSDEGGAEVLVVTPDSVAHETKVETGAQQGDRVQIVSGLKGGENVIVGGGAGLADNSKVRMEAAGKSEEHE